jgi:hypothetical protein
MDKQLIAKYLGCFGNGYKFENEPGNVLIFKRCSMDFVRKYGLWTEMNINQNFKIEYVYFDKETMVINKLVMI